MPTPATDGFTPDYAVTPGEILEETLESRGIKKSAFAERCGLSAKTVSQIIHGKAPVTPETAIQFERVLGVSAAVWNNLEAFSRSYGLREFREQGGEEDLGRRGRRRWGRGPRRQPERTERLRDFYESVSEEQLQGMLRDRVRHFLRGGRQVVFLLPGHYARQAQQQLGEEFRLTPVEEWDSGRAHGWQAWAVQGG